MKGEELAKMWEQRERIKTVELERTREALAQLLEAVERIVRTEPDWAEDSLTLMAIERAKRA